MPAPVLGLDVGFFTVVLRLACIGKVTDNVRFRTKTLCYLGVYRLSIFSAVL